MSEQVLEKNKNEIEEVVNTLTENMPEPQDHAINHFETEVKKKESEINQIPEQYRNLIDSDGKHFDPAIHRTNKEGKPSLSKNGNLMRRGVGSNSAAMGDTQRPARKSFVAGVDPLGNGFAPAVPSQENLALGMVTANLIFTIGVGIGGEEWQPKKDETIGLDEKKYLTEAFAEYYRATGQKDLPPNLTLALALSVYILPRMTMEKTQSRLKNFFTWLGAKWVGWRSKKAMNAPA